MTLDDPQLFEHPWIYFVEPGSCRLTDSEVAEPARVPAARRHGDVDDFHGPFEWDNFERADEARCFPIAGSSRSRTDHPVFRCFYKLDGYPQVAGHRLVPAGRTWEKGGFVPHLRTILDDAGRPMMFINWNTDMGDGWEWSNVEEYPGYLKYTVDGLPDGDQRDRLFPDALADLEGQLALTDVP